MPKKKAGAMLIAPNFNQMAVNYASQGNSIIGIRNSGKTYAATKVAEQLLDNGIPIIAFDPTGVWKHLRSGVNGNTGYPVVVAGGMDADLPLNEKNAVEILEAALKANISLVFDFHGIASTSKTKWLHIVSICVEFLIGNNLQYGLRHIFFEEAAEFVPQRQQPGGQLAYSRIESLARQGRNFGMGYTLINQRAEEIAKAIFEICEQVFVFRQAGKNSLKSISSWLDYRGLEKYKEIVTTLPNLASGECWVINQEQEIKVKISQKKTFHPDPKNNRLTLPAGAKVADRTEFIDRMKILMEQKANVQNNTVKSPVSSKPSLPKRSFSEQGNADIIQKLKGIIEAKDSEISMLKMLNKKLLQAAEAANKKLSAVEIQLKKIDTGVIIIPTNETSLVKPESKQGFEIYGNSKSITASTFVKDSSISSSIPKNTTSLPAGEFACLTCIAQFGDNGATRTQITMLTGYKKSSRDAFISRLKTRGLIEQKADRCYVTHEGLNLLGVDFKRLPTGKDLQVWWLNNLPEGERKVLEICINSYPDAVTRINIDHQTGYKKSSRDAFISRLIGKELIIPIQQGLIIASEHLF